MSPHHDYLPEDMDGSVSRGCLSGCALQTAAVVLVGTVLMLAVLFAPAIALELHRAGVL